MIEAPLESPFERSSSAELQEGGGAGLNVQLGDDGVAVLEFDQPGVQQNRFTAELLQRLDVVLDELRACCSRGEVKGIVLASAKRGSFIVGVDVAAIAAVPDEATAEAATLGGQAIFQKLEDLPVPSVAAINGTCLGGATEMALACSWRVAADTNEVEIGLPEVNLGIFPGFGGSQRLPRTISLERALPMILAGKSIGVRKARKIGLVDLVVPPPLLVAEARRRALLSPRRRRRQAPEDRPVGRRLRRWLLEGQPLGRAALFRRARQEVLRRGGERYPAPMAALETVRRGFRRPLDQALRIEARRVAELIVSAESRNLVSIFLSRQKARRLAREAGVGESSNVLGRANGVGKLGVVGAGVMGGGIAQLAAYHRIPVRIKDVASEALTAAFSVAHERFLHGQRAGKLARRDVAARMALISATLEYSGFATATLVIEAVVEDVGVKRLVLGEIEAIVARDAVVATNTSSLTLAELGASMQRPERLVGLHFFNPVHRMPLVEVVRADDTADEAVARVLRFAHRLGKVPVVVADSPGFLVNRVLTPYLNEALLLVESGNGIAAVDTALERFGMPMGPLRLLDEIGLDVADQVAERLGPLFAGRLQASGAGRRMRDAGRPGRKASHGFYRYGSGRPTPDDPSGILAGTARDGSARGRGADGVASAAAGNVAGGGAVSPDEIIDRCVLLLLNEACYALQEQIVASPSELDLAIVMGTGFAPFRGGILRHAEAIGVSALRDRMAELAERCGSRFEPAPLLRDVAETSGSFYA